MNSILRRRRALMLAQTKSWEDVTPPLSNFVPHTNTTCIKDYDAINNTLRIYNTSKTSFAGGYIPVTLTDGYKYRVRYTVLIVKGVNRANFSDANQGTLLSPGSGNVRDSGDVEFTYPYSGSPVVVALRLMCTTNTNEFGDCTISNFKMERVLI